MVIIVDTSNFILVLLEKVVMERKSNDACACKAFPLLEEKVDPEIETDALIITTAAIDELRKVQFVMVELLDTV